MNKQPNLPEGNERTTNSTTINGPSVAEQYQAIQEEYMHCVHSRDQSYMITLTGLAALYSWLLARSQQPAVQSPRALWLVGPLFIVLSFLKQHATNRRAEKLGALMDTMEKRIIDKDHTLHNAREECRWEKHTRLVKVEPGLIPNLWWIFWGGLLLVSFLLTGLGFCKVI